MKLAKSFTRVVLGAFYLNTDFGRNSCGGYGLIEPSDKNGVHLKMSFHFRDGLKSHRFTYIAMWF